jgi:hypothetical protein
LEALDRSYFFAETGPTGCQIRLTPSPHHWPVEHIP